jgi:hypothetical protein
MWFDFLLSVVAKMRVDQQWNAQTRLYTRKPKQFSCDGSGNVKANPAKRALFIAVRVRSIPNASINAGLGYQVPCGRQEGIPWDRTCPTGGTGGFR